MAQELIAQYHKEGDWLDYTNASGDTITAGTPVAVAGRVGLLFNDLADGETAAVRVKGLVKIRKITGAMATPGTAIYFDDDGNPLNGTAGSGAATATAGSNLLLGSLVYAAADTDETCIVALNEFTNAAVLATE